MNKERKYPKEIEWLRNKADYLTISRIEQDLQMPNSTLHNFVKGKYGLAEQWHEKVVEWVKKFRKQ